MSLSPSIQSVLSRHQAEIYAALRRTVMRASNAAARSEIADLQPYYGQIQYHLGWVNSDFSPAATHPGKLLRPTLLLLAYEAAGAWGLATETPDYLRRAMPAAVAVELTHNFTLIHDDIEDGDTERRHRPTLWKLWGIPQSINTGDGLFALGRLALWGVVDEGVESSIAARLGAILDLACLTLSEGQYLDISFEGRQDVSVAMYIDLISRKTGALMRCAAEMGALLGTRDQETVERLSSFGRAIGVAFQARDDLLGVWASKAELGKTSAGDILRRKKSLPILHALEQADEQDQLFLRNIYEQETPVTGEQVEAVLAIFARTRTRDYCREFLADQCRLAHEALANVPRSESSVAARALDDLKTLIHFIEEQAREQ
jgi:geranylgeranyl diphosphate synthase type I